MDGHSSAQTQFMEMQDAEALDAPPAPRSTIENVLSLQPNQLVSLVEDDFVDDDDDGEGVARDLNDGEVSDADSDDYRLQADIAKLDADVAAFKASMAADLDSDPEDMIDPLLKSSLPGRPRKRGPKKGGERPTKRKRRNITRNIVEPTGEIKLLLIQASDALMKRDVDQALEIISEIIRINAETYDAWVMLSSIYQEREQTADAIMAMCFAAHLRPRDFFGWMNCAQFALDDPNPDDRERNLETAQLCFSAAIRAKPKSYKARVGKANCALEAGKSSVAAAEYVKVLRKRPYNMTILRNMAEAAFDTWSAKKYVEKAKDFYELAIAHVRQGGHLLKGTFEWSDVNIYVEMCAFLDRHQDATLALRSLARMLIGRQEETFWDKFVDDDREWDMLDDRRHEVPDFVPGKHSSDMYGAALPLDLRAKLAIYRLKLGQEEEAMRHLAWLSPDPGPDNAFVHEYFEDTPYLIKDIANQLFENRKVDTALEFYEFYERLSLEADTDLFVQKGKCYLEIGDRTMAEDFFLRALEEDEENIDARVELAQMYEAHQETEQAFMMVNQAIKLTAQQQQEDEEDNDDFEPNVDGEDDAAVEKVRRRRRIRRKVLREKAKGQRPDRPKRQYVRRMANKAKRQEYEDKVTEGFRNKYQKAQELRERMAAGDLAAEEEWMAAAQTLVDDFRSFKDFYPWDKYLSFMGYGSFFQENRQKPKDKQRAETTEPETNEFGRARSRAGTVAPGEAQLTAMAERLQQNLAPHEENGPQPVLRRQEHRGIPFDNWLDLLLDYAVSLARRQQAQEAYVVCQSARDSIVYKSSDSTFLIHVAWAACAVFAADEETCVAIARFFMTFQHASTDSYRVFSALCRVCQSPVSWYSSGPAQKYILRQIKMMDRGLLPLDLAQAALGAWDTAVPRDDSHGGARHEALDVSLLMLYGHILLTSTSYTYALNYFLRAASLDPENPMVNLSAGIAYVHYAMKRQAENRQFIIAQGMHYMYLYYDERVRSPDVMSRLEAHYNLGRCYHLLGIFHLAAEFYARCLGEAERHRKWLEGREEKGQVLKAFVYESAVNLRTYALTNGDFDGARALTETWLVL